MAFFKKHFQANVFGNSGDALRGIGTKQFYECNVKNTREFKDLNDNYIPCRPMPKNKKGKGILWNEKYNKPWTEPKIIKGYVIKPNLNIFDYRERFNGNYDPTYDDHKLPIWHSSVKNNIKRNENNDKVDDKDNNSFLNMKCANENENITDYDQSKLICFRGKYVKETKDIIY